MILISNLTLSIKDGSTIASTLVYGDDKQTYINIGSGNVFKLEWEWETPVQTNDIVDHYSLVIKRHDTTLNVYYDILNENIGLVNEFYVDSPMLPAVPYQYMLSIYIVAYGKSGSVVTSNVINPYISKGSGAYIRVENGYAQPIMKRALAFAKKQEALASLEGEVLKDAEGNTLFALDASTLKTELYLADLRGVILTDPDGEPLIVEATRVLENINGWVVMQEGYTKDADGEWHINDIKYEVLVDENGEIITDSNNEPIYIL